MQNLITRTITGAIFVALIIGSLLAHPFAFAGVIYIIMILSMLEFYQLAKGNEIFPQKITGLLAGSLIFILLALVFLQLIPPVFLAFIALLAMAFFVSALFSDKPNAMHNMAFSILPVVYISIPLAMLVFLTGPVITGDHSHWYIAFGFFIILWSDDTFAYLTGMLFGKHKLFEKISPKKTWEGTMGGVIFGMIAAYILSLFFTELSLAEWLGAALVITVTGTLGDLSESLLKRKFNVKDSGTLLPGHGGVLDRIDSVLFAAPALSSYLVLLNL